MAKPRIFISSTFYDLRQVREDLERFIKGLGYEPVRHETGRIPYSKDEKLETSAYREIELCDVVVTIVGGRFGTESHDQPGYSITQTEIRRALERGIPVFIFVDRSALSEYSTYQLNKGNKDIKYRFVDDPRIYEFLEVLYGLPKNNPITPFETAKDITDFLQEQWAGLFQRFLQQQQRLSEVRTLNEMNAVAATLRELVTFLTKEKQSGDEAIKTILLSNHPVFRRLASLTKTAYRVFFSNREEMVQWLEARNWEEILPEYYDAGSSEEWTHDKIGYLLFKTRLFDEDGRLKVFTENDWNDDWIVLKKPTKHDEDDIPF
jgi:hypothetical protein